MGKRDFRHRESKKPKKDAKQTPIVTIIQPSTKEVLELAKNREKARKEKGDTEEEG